MKNYFLIGDIHGDIRAVRDFSQRCIQTHKVDADNTLICLGDFGANYYFNYRDDKFKQELNKYPFTYFVLRGNHEERPSNMMKLNPEGWQIEEYCGGPVYVEKAYPYIKYMMDEPTVYMIDGRKTLAIPGAYSIDKHFRLQNGWSWFPEEQLTEREMEKGRTLCEINQNRFDLILSHTCPTLFEPTDLFISSIDQSTVDNTMERYLTYIEYEVIYDHWFWAHFHDDRVYPEGKQIMLFQKGMNLNEIEKGFI